MREFFEVDEFKKIDEFKEIKAENYSKVKEIFASKEYKNDINENYSKEKSSPDENDTSNALANENQEFDKNDFSKDINSTANNTSSNFNTNVDKITNSVSTNVISKVSTVVGTAAATAVGSIGAVIVCSNLLISSPKVEIVSIDTGADYIYYDVDITELSDDVVYTLIIENGYGTYKFAVEEGKNANLVSGLKPYCKYNISLVSDNKDMGGYRTYYEKSFYTKKASKPNAILNYDLVPDYENNMLNLDYNVYISDYYKQGTDYYYTVSYKDNVIYTNDDLTDDYYFNGTLNNVSEGDYVFSYYCNLYDEDIVVGTDIISVQMPDDLIPSVVDYEIDNITMTGNYNDGYDLNIALSGYNSNATYELEITSDSFNKTYEFNKESLELKSLPIDYQSCKLNLIINEDITYEYSLVDLVGINVSYGNPIYSEEDNLSIIDYKIDGLDVENGINVSVTNNYNETNTYELTNNKVYVDLSGDVLLTTVIETETLALKFTQEFDLGNKITLENLEYAIYKEENVLFVKLIKYLPLSSNIYLSCDGTKLEEAFGYEYMDGYYAFNCSRLNDDNIIQIHAEIDGNTIDCGDIICNIDTNYSLPEYSIAQSNPDNNEILNPNDYMITYNDDNTYNAYIPINFMCTDENMWYRIIINNEVYFESKDYIYLVENLDIDEVYSFKYEIYYMYKGISYLVEDFYSPTELSINNNEPEAEVIFDNSASTIEVLVSNYEINKNIVVTYMDSTSEDALLDEDFIATYDNTKIIDYITIKYSDKIVDEIILDDNNIPLVGEVYKEYVINLAPYEFVAESISYRTLDEYDADYNLSTNNYLYVKSSKLEEDGYDIYLQQGTTTFEPLENKVEGYFVFDANSLSKDVSFDIKVLNTKGELISVGNNTTFTVISDTSALTTPTAWQTPNPGDCLLTYNEDNTFNAYIPINFESTDENVWYRIRLGENVLFDSTDYSAVVKNLDSTRYYSLKYEIYYNYNGISYCIADEYPSGSLYSTPTSSSMSIEYNHQGATFSIYSLRDPIKEDILITYTDDSTEVVALNSDGIGTYDNSKIIKTITIYYCFSKVDKTKFPGITIEGEEYLEYVFEVEPPYEIIIDEVVYGSKTNSQYLYVYSSKVNTDGYSLCLVQDENYYYPLENEKESWFVFDVSGITFDTSFDLIALDVDDNELPLLTNVTYTITSQIPEYAVNEFSAIETMITYNDDNTFNAYIPICFECSDETLWYKLYLNDEMVAEGRDYLTTVQNLDSTKTYQIKYEIYYENNGIVYYIEGNTITDEISVSSDLSSTTVTFDKTTSTFELQNVDYDISSDVEVTYTDTTNETITLDSTLKGSYDNSKVIDFVTIKYSIKVVDESILNDKNIPLIGNMYKEYEIDVDAYEFVAESIAYRTLDEYDADYNVSTNSYLYIKSDKLLSEGYDIYLEQGTTKFEPLENKVDRYFVFDANSLTKDVSFDIKVLNNTGEIVNVGNNTAFTVISDTSSLTATTAWRFPNPGDCMLTYNEDNTFNAYVPINFESTDTNVWYRIRLNDNILYDSTEYIALIENLDESLYYSIRYEIYYEYQNISYCIAEAYPSGSISAQFDLSSASVTCDTTLATFNVEIGYSLSDKAIVEYTDGTIEEVTIADYTGSYDNTKTIKNVTVYYTTNSSDYSLNEATLIELGITIKGNVYKEHIIVVSS